MSPRLQMDANLVPARIVLDRDTQVRNRFQQKEASNRRFHTQKNGETSGGCPTSVIERVECGPALSAGSKVVGSKPPGAKAGRVSAGCPSVI